METVFDRHLVTLYDVMDLTGSAHGSLANILLNTVLAHTYVGCENFA